MLDWFHNFTPSPVLIAFGPLTIYWYGAIIVLALLFSLGVAMRLAPGAGLRKEDLIDLSFWLIAAGIVGARAYHVILEFPSYIAHPANILKVWQGGLAIHGAIAGGLIALLVFTRKHKLSFTKIAALMVAPLSLAQAIGRWGNFFNQELFGLPTDLPWGIQIVPALRPTGYLYYEYFHPAFLYESLLSLAVFAFLWRRARRAESLTEAERGRFDRYTIAWYFLLYSIIRFTLELIRLDRTPVFLGWRFPQIVSFVLILITATYLSGLSGRIGKWLPGTLAKKDI